MSRFCLSGMEPAVFSCGTPGPRYLTTANSLISWCSRCFLQPSSCFAAGDVGPRLADHRGVQTGPGQTHLLRSGGGQVVSPLTETAVNSSVRFERKVICVCVCLCVPGLCGHCRSRGTLAAGQPRHHRIVRGAWYVAIATCHKNVFLKKFIMQLDQLLHFFGFHSLFFSESLIVYFTIYNIILLRNVMII